MHAFLPDFEVYTPRSLREALALLNQNNHKPLAGGTDLMVLLAAGNLPAGSYLNVNGLEELGGMEVGKDKVRLGALTTYTEIRRQAILCKEFPNLVAAARQTGALAIQNRGTIGGNIANASPAADSPPALLTYDAEIKLISEKGTRVVPYKDFHLGYKKTLLGTNELIHSVYVPRRFRNWHHYYRKVGARKSQAISKVIIAACALMNKDRIQDIRLSAGSVAPYTLRCFQTEEILRGEKKSQAAIQKAKTMILSEISPINDIRSTAKYRRYVTTQLLEEFLLSLP
ncbi:MAG: xanthine dehydrogenase family protein subunit M [Deltaproteobacteria bacterium]|nr:xanthine dehydrogenase family protein subunit M [Deltaproteobacteria bacterium]